MNLARSIDDVKVNSGKSIVQSFCAIILPFTFGKRTKTKWGRDLLLLAIQLPLALQYHTARSDLGLKNLSEFINVVLRSRRLARNRSQQITCFHLIGRTLPERLDSLFS